jgi:hypothetical protein
LETIPIQRVRRSHNGTKAIEEAQRLRPDFVVLNLSMRILNGMDATRKIKTYLPKMPIIQMPIMMLSSNGVLTTDIGGSSLLVLGVNGVKRLRWMLVFFLLGASVCAFAVPRADSPETAFNEADAPVNLAPPVQLRIQIIVPTLDPFLVVPTTPVHCTGCVIHGTLLEAATMLSQRHRRSLQDLLCTLLI